MSKIYEALQQAQREQGRVRKLPVVPTPTVPRGSPARNLELSMEKEVISLYQTIDSLLPNLAKKVIQFIGSLEGEGTSTIAREFARVSATTFNDRVLLLDGNRNKPSLHLVFNLRPKYGWEDVLGDGEAIDKAVYQIGDSSLFVCPVSPHSPMSTQSVDTPKLKDLLEGLRQRFDLVLIDSSPANTSPDGIAFCPRVDGVVLILGAEKTRWQVIERVKEQITKNGGNVLGMVFNKRRYYIPDFIYRRL